MKNIAIKKLVENLFNENYRNETLENIEVEFMFHDNNEYCFNSSIASMHDGNDVLRSLDIRINTNDSDFESDYDISVKSVRNMLFEQYKNTFNKLKHDIICTAPNKFTFETVDNNQLDDVLNIDVRAKIMTIIKFC